MQKNVAFFPGCFDPIHKRHIAIIKHLIKMPNIDEIWILINSYSEEKTIQVSFEERLEMAKITLGKTSKKINFYPTAIDFYTTEVIKKEKIKNPENNFYLVLGSDQALQIPFWENAEELREITKFIIFPRSNFLVKAPFLDNYENIVVNDFEATNTCSSRIREGFNWKEVLPETKKYIFQKKLYLDLILQQNVCEDREFHSFAVAKLAVKIARIHGLIKKQNKIFIAGLMHDVCKEWSTEKHIKFWKDHVGSATEIEKYPEPVWHGKTATLYLKTELNIDDQEVLEAIKNHTTGSLKSTTFHQILMLADKLEKQKNDVQKKLLDDLLNKRKSVSEAYFILMKIIYDKLIAEKKTPTSELIEIIKAKY